VKAVVQESYGAADVLRLSDLADPRPDAGHAVVRIRAAGLNWHDVLVRRGQYGSPLPHVPGADGAGTDVETGEPVMIMPSLHWGAEEAAPGPRWEILGDHRPGTYAELVRVPRENLAPKPAGLDWTEAAALPLVGLTTFRALFSRGRLRAGERLLVLGAGGGIATMAVSLAAAVGAVVHVTSSSEDKIARARELGAAGGVRYDDPDWPTAATALTGGFDLVLDPVGSWADAVRTLRPGARLVVLGANRAERAELDIRPFFFGQYNLLGSTMGSPADFAGLLRLLETHRVPPPVIDRTFALDHAAEAHSHLESGAVFGKTVLMT